MARYKLILAYDGSGFWGSQRQTGRRTIQGELEKAASVLGWEGRSIQLAGRTDQGVHAQGQVAAIDIEWAHGGSGLLRALNAHLPADIAVQKASVVPADFHPRFDALGRRYQYRLIWADSRQPRWEGTAWRTWPAIPCSDLNKASAALVGKHDFGAFGSAPKPGGTTVRTVQAVDWRRSGEFTVMDIQADGFLYRMARRVAFVIVNVCHGRLPMETVVEALRSPVCSKLPAGLAPAQGLSLMAVVYPRGAMREDRTGKRV